MRDHAGRPRVLPVRATGSGVRPGATAAGRHRKLPPLWSTLNHDPYDDPVGLANRTTYGRPVPAAAAIASAASGSVRISRIGSVVAAVAVAGAVPMSAASALRTSAM